MPKCEKCGPDENLNTAGVCMACCPHEVIELSSTFYREGDFDLTCTRCGMGSLQDIVGLKHIIKNYKLVKK